MTEHKDIGQAIAAVMAEVGYVQKETTAALRYSFASEAGLIHALRPAMVKHGIFCYVSDVLDVKQDTFETAKGSVLNRATVRGTVLFTHAPSGTSIDAHATGEGMDMGDKSVNKASTGMLKYALRQTFLIETGDDPDAFSSEEQEQVAPVKSAAPMPKASGPVKVGEDAVTMFWQLATKWELDKEQAAEMLTKHGNNFLHAYEALKASLEPEGPAQ